MTLYMLSNDNGLSNIRLHLYIYHPECLCILHVHCFFLVCVCVCVCVCVSFSIVPSCWLQIFYNLYKFGMCV